MNMTNGTGCRAMVVVLLVVILWVVMLRVVMLMIVMLMIVILVVVILVVVVARVVVVLRMVGWWQLRSTKPPLVPSYLSLSPMIPITRKPFAGRDTGVKWMLDSQHCTGQAG